MKASIRRGFDVTDHTLAGLVKVRADLIKEHDTLKARCVAIAGELAHVDAVIRLVDPNHRSPTLHMDAREVSAIARGERSRALLDVMREAGEPITAAEAARRTMLKQGHDPEDRAHRKVITKKVEAALWRQERRGVLRSLRREGQVMVWEVKI